MNSQNILLETLKRCYLKHHLNDPDIGWDELDDEMMTTLCEAMGDKEFQKWLGGENEKYLGTTEWVGPSGRKWKVDLYQKDE